MNMVAIDLMREMRIIIFHNFKILTFVEIIKEGKR